MEKSDRIRQDEVAAFEQAVARVHTKEREARLMACLANLIPEF